jgi:transposase
LSEVSLRLGSHTQAVEEMAGGARRWTQLAEQAPAVHRMLSKKLKPGTLALGPSPVLIPERASASPILTARQQRYQAAQADEARRDARRAEHNEQLRRERKAAALELAAEGKTQREISAELGLNRATVAGLIPGATVAAQALKRPKTKTQSAEVRVKAIATAGTTPEHVAERAGVSVYFARQVMARMGVWTAPRAAAPKAATKTLAGIEREAKYERAVALIQAGHTSAEVAEACGWARASHVSRVLGKMGVPMPKRKRATQEEIIAAYDAHATVHTVAKELHVHQRRVVAVLREAGKLRAKGSRRPESSPGGRPALLDDATIEELAARWRQGGVTRRELAEEYSVSLITISNYLARAGIKAGETVAEQRREWREQAVELYQQGLTLQQVADKIGGTATRVHNALRTFGYTAKTARPQSAPPARGRKPKLSDEVSAKIVARYARGESVEALAQAYGCSLSTAYDRVRRARWSGALERQGRQA